MIGKLTESLTDLYEADEENPFAYTFSEYTPFIS